jgi:hypothetical protein
MEDLPIVSLRRVLCHPKIASYELFEASFEDRFIEGALAPRSAKA